MIIDVAMIVTHILWIITISNTHSNFRQEKPADHKNKSQGIRITAQKTHFLKDHQRLYSEIVKIISYSNISSHNRHILWSLKTTFGFIKGVLQLS